MLLSFASCGDSQESSSELSSNVSESATEEITTEAKTTIEEPTTEKATELTTKYILPELDKTYEYKDIIFKYSSEWEKDEKKKIVIINNELEINIYAT
ncbi:MAG: hypothetical protein K2H19_07630, partial [Ruminococcus sp.]|nr:hypothetical protein [Ruminococcus sp.]